MIELKTLDFNYYPGFQKRTLLHLPQSILTFSDFVDIEIKPNVLFFPIHTLNYDKPQSLYELNNIIPNYLFIHVPQNDLNIYPEIKNILLFSDFYYTTLYHIQNIINTFTYSLIINDVDNININNNLIIFEIPIASIEGTSKVKLFPTDPINHNNIFHNYKQYFFIHAQIGYPILFYDVNNTHIRVGISDEYASHFNNPSFPIYITPQHFNYRTSVFENVLLGHETLVIKNQIYNIGLPKEYGLNIITEGPVFENYLKEIYFLSKTLNQQYVNITKRKLLPEFLFLYDTQDKRFTFLVNTLSMFFDEIKTYINNISNAYTFNYDIYHRAPKQYVFKHLKNFNIKTNVILNEHINLSLYNFINNILKNIVYLYKTKGTRNYVETLLKIYNIPEDFIIFNEYIYTHQPIYNLASSFVASDGYANLENALYAFQERGLGLEYFDAYRNIFQLQKNIDNSKITTESNRHILNTKEVELYISPQPAINKDVKNWLALIEDIPLQDISDTEIHKLLLQELYGPQKIKTVYNQHPSSEYFLLNYIYALYLHLSWPNVSNHFLNYYKCEQFLYPYEKILQVLQFPVLPATTIAYHPMSFLYKNIILQASKYNYKHGIDDGSLFKTQEPVIPTANNILQHITYHYNETPTAHITHNSLTFSQTSDVLAHSHCSYFQVFSHTNITSNTNMAVVNIYSENYNIHSHVQSTVAMYTDISYEEETYNYNINNLLH